MRVIFQLALACAVAVSTVPAPAFAGWVGNAIKSQKPQCPPKKPAKSAGSKRISQR